MASELELDAYELESLQLGLISMRDFRQQLDDDTRKLREANDRAELDRRLYEMNEFREHLRMQAEAMPGRRAPAPAPAPEPLPYKPAPPEPCGYCVILKRRCVCRRYGGT